MADGEVEVVLMEGFKRKNDYFKIMGVEQETLGEWGTTKT